MLGHASAAMTLDVYAGLFEDSLDGVADRMDAMARGAADFLRTSGRVAAFPIAQEMRSKAPDLRRRKVGQQGLEPWTDGL